MMIAEESTAWGGVTAPAHEGGLGFNFKWNMGWMHDILDYMQCDPYFRKGNHNKLTFPMMYAFAENYILALSHDEVVHGKRSLIEKMWGTYEEKFSELRLLYAFMYSHPGKKLLFMGGEFGQFVEWRFAEQLDWMLDEYELHRGMAKFTADLGKFYQENKPFYEVERELGGDWKGFKWLKASDAENSVLAYLRLSEDQKEEIMVVLNFTPIGHALYTVGVPEEGDYTVVINSNDKKYGGDGTGSRTYHTKKIPCDDFEYSVDIVLPPLTALYLKKSPITARSKKSKAVVGKTAETETTKKTADKKPAAKKVPAKKTTAKKTSAKKSTDKKKDENN